MEVYYYIKYDKWYINWYGSLPGERRWKNNSVEMGTFRGIYRQITKKFNTTYYELYKCAEDQEW